MSPKVLQSERYWPYRVINIYFHMTKKQLELYGMHARYRYQ